MRDVVRLLALVSFFACWLWSAALAADDPAADLGWNEILAEARGQEVYWKAWAGSEATNSYIRWVADEVAARYGVELTHVKITNPAELVSGTLAEKTAGRHQDGATDMLWINGENFQAMKEQGLLYGPFTHKLPNFTAYVDPDDPTYRFDFTVPVEGLEAPWGKSQVVFVYDTAVTSDPPRSMRELLRFAKANPGRVTHPQVRYFLGATFLKQALYELSPDPGVLQQPATNDVFEQTTEPLWAWYDELRPHLWRDGRQFPESGPAQHQLLADGEVDLSISFMPFEPSHLIETGRLPGTVRTYVFDAGTIGNANFLAIPYNSSSKEGAMAIINFLLSPEAQLRGQNPVHRGSFTVLDMSRLPPEYRRKFDELDIGPATLTPAELGTPLPEPHPSWMNRIRRQWYERYGN